MTEEVHASALAPLAPVQPIVITLREENLDELVTRAAERGAERCLAHLGLENGHAARDIRELRDLLEVWRDARRTAWHTVVKLATTGILTVIVVGAAIKFKVIGGRPMIETLLGGLQGGAFRLSPEFLKWLDRQG